MGGTEAFPDLGKHCQDPNCNQLDFLPFTCDGCRKVFCLEHRSYKSHACEKADPKNRTVMICEICEISIEREEGGRDEDEAIILERHQKSGDCDPCKKKKAKCPVKRCKEVLTFSNSFTCKACHLKLCLGHRFPSDHNCHSVEMKSSFKLLSRMASAAMARSGKDCGGEERLPAPPPRSQMMI